jgi:hypothetical protein
MKLRSNLVWSLSGTLNVRNVGLKGDTTALYSKPGGIKFQRLFPGQEFLASGTVKDADKRTGIVM